MFSICCRTCGKTFGEDNDLQILGRIFQATHPTGECPVGCKNQTLRIINAYGRVEPKWDVEYTYFNSYGVQIHGAPGYASASRRQRVVSRW